MLVIVRTDCSIPSIEFLKKFPSMTQPFMVFCLCLWPLITSLSLIFPPLPDLHVGLEVPWLWSQPFFLGSRQLRSTDQAVSLSLLFKLFILYWGLASILFTFPKTLQIWLWAQKCQPYYFILVWYPIANMWPELDMKIFLRCESVIIVLNHPINAQLVLLN